MPEKILITGPPRSGTTLMLMFFYRGGFNIGYSHAEVAKYYKEQSNGFEYMTDTRYWDSEKSDKEIPDVLKETFRLSNYEHITIIDWALIYKMKIKNLIVCVRSDLDETKKSLERLLERKKRISRNKQRYEDPKFIDKKFTEIEKCSYLFLRQIVKYDLSPTFIEYPRFKTDLDYCYNKLGRIFDIPKAKYAIFKI